MRITTAASLLALVAAPVASAQLATTPRAQAFAYQSFDDPNRAMLGISTSPSGKRDTLGLLVTAVTAGSPAEKAGLEEGNRLISINGVSLKLSRDDAGDDDMQGVNQNRLTREMRKVKAGDEVSLEVWGGGRARTVKVKTVAAEELSPPRRSVTIREDDRAALGVFLSSTGSKRDTVGVFVQQVVEGGPADKAGIVEGDRIASINGVDVRVPREDAGDWNMASTRIGRLDREVRKLKPGQVADLVVVSGGRSRTVKVTAVKASELPGGGGAFGVHTPGGMIMRVPAGGGGTTIIRPDLMQRMIPRIRIDRRMDDDAEVRAHIEAQLKGLDHLGPAISAELDQALNRELPRAMDELRRELPRAMDELRWELPRALDELRWKLPRAIDETGFDLKQELKLAPKLRLTTGNRVIL